MKRDKDGNLHMFLDFKDADPDWINKWRERKVRQQEETMGSVTAKRADERSLMEMRTVFGKSGKEYLLVKVRRRRADHINAFVACELKEASLDIVGKEVDSPDRPKGHALAMKAWGK
ncbi:MAG TPA: hypothetical protein VG206_14535 [Terriglobia bacterium]|nr:hypothetical protein [Terriglobia bacterium]